VRVDTYGVNHLRAFHTKTEQCRGAALDEHVRASRYLVAMRWFARPENNAHQLRVAPRLASWNKAGDPDQIRLRAYLDDTDALLAASRVDGPWTLRLDVGVPVGRNLLNMADLDNYAYPLARRLKDSDLVSVWCTKQHSDQSFVRIEAARESLPPATDVVVVGTPSAKNSDYKGWINAAVADAVELPTGPVRLELSFVVGRNRNWLELWKPTIDALEPLLGRDPSEDRPWHPRDGRITELGMHVTVDSAASNTIIVGIAAAPASYAPVKSAVAIPALSPTMREFRDDDAGYLAWLAAHPDGYVINIARRYYLSTARVHHARCRTISGQNPRGGAWTGPYVKVCAEHLAELGQWAINQVGEPIPPCGSCHPC
jgi:hypothetical protein